MATFRQVRQFQGDLVIAKMSDKITNIFNLLASPIDSHLRDRGRSPRQIRT